MTNSGSDGYKEEGGGGGGYGILFWDQYNLCYFLQKRGALLEIYV